MTKNMRPTPWPAPVDRAGWDALHTIDPGVLESWGLRRWNAPGDAAERDLFGGATLWLFPAEWYKHIPVGFPVVSISGRRLMFVRGVSDDQRFGCLAYGVLVAASEGQR